MHLPEVFRTTTFGVAAVASAFYTAATLLLFAFILWQTAGYETLHTDQFLVHEAMAIAREPADRIVPDVTIRYSNDLHRLTFACVFAPDGTAVAGDLKVLPPGLPLDGEAHGAVVAHTAQGRNQAERVRLVGLRLPDHRILLVGRSSEALAKLRRVVLRALGLGLVPGIGLALAAGILASRRALARIGRMNAAIDSIMSGQLQTRLPARPSADIVEQLAASVNRMLDEIERLVGEMKGVGDAISHDLRTPLARVRSRLETGRLRARSQDELAFAVDGAIADLDQTFSMITALLRIGEIEGAQRRAGFGDCALAPILVELVDLYQPVAELRQIDLTLEPLPDGHDTVRADRDLLFEAMANLVDNAVKFTPPGGCVRLCLELGPEGPAMWVKDTGPGIAAGEREAVLQRFYRADRSRGEAGNGLGLSLVMAIVRLHGFTLVMRGGAGGFSVGVVGKRGSASL